MSPEELRQVVAENIRAAAGRRGMSLNALADFSGLSRPGLHFIVTAKKSATLDSLAQIAAALEVEPASLLAPRPPAQDE